MKKQKIFETDLEYVIYNIRPANKGQCLVVPKRHVENVRELDNQEVASLFRTVKLVSTKLKNYLNCEGFNYGFNEGSLSGQTVPHLHFHILPRIDGDNISEFHFFHRDPKTKRNLSDEEIEPYISEFKKIF